MPLPRWIPTLCAVALLAGCGTPTQTAAVINSGITLASVAAANNSTAAKIVSDGALICGKINSTTGQLLTDGLEVAASALGAPLMVTGAISSAVAASCPAGTVPGPLPAGVDPSTVPVVPVAGSSLPTVPAT
jgi:hypothetical protein